MKTIHNQITPPDKAIRYLSVKEKAGHYSIGIFVFPPNATIPLHNHPGMIVLSRVLYGSLKAKTYDIIYDKSNSNNHKINTSDEDSESKKSWIPNFVSRVLHNNYAFREEIPKGCIHVYANQEQELMAPQITELYPDKSNVHEFQAGPNGVAVLDVLVPPYDVENERDCTFYRENRDYFVPDMTDDIHNGAMRHDNMDVDYDCDSTRRRVWLEPIEQPDWFHCISGQYGIGSFQG